MLKANSGSMTCNLAPESIAGYKSYVYIRVIQ